ncbi:MipA/OmpV family protein [Rhodanobacter sp. DHG33]|uniref:MipA/OmpV family protein n=1 Tax=Rhodanobacter sp. DHG33 TaxID=2775921 RepID=UPI00177EF333|nr:MipA/OmpV family protein [Rhodanobacter sp. DHG33]MBD8899933.1 MipA/OmpV family protein [Rhodanobacter sp. DHG33]
MTRLFPTTGPLRRLALCACLFIALPWTTRCLADDGDQPTYAIGAGMERMAAWPGASTARNQPIPFIDIEIPDHLSLSTLDGLQLDLIGGPVLHGGFYGDYQWGRDSDDLGVLRGKIAPLSPRLTAGGYLEWQLAKQVDAGIDLSHDIDGAGAYLEAYGEWDLPPVWLLQHSFEMRWQAMNGAAMDRFFGISPAQADTLAVPAWHPGAGSQSASLEYDLFVPTSQHTGLALALSWERLLGNAGGSPLVTRFGSRNQPSESLAFVYHF